jgi:hypothetical protein
MMMSGLFLVWIIPSLLVGEGDMEGYFSVVSQFDIFDRFRRHLRHSSASWNPACQTIPA